VLTLVAAELFFAGLDGLALYELLGLLELLFALDILFPPRYDGCPIATCAIKKIAAIVIIRFMTLNFKGSTIKKSIIVPLLQQADFVIFALFVW
jgi:hypothetical protein